MMLARCRAAPIPKHERLVQPLGSEHHDLYRQLRLNFALNYPFDHEHTQVPRPIPGQRPRENWGSLPR